MTKLRLFYLFHIHARPCIIANLVGTATIQYDNAYHVLKQIGASVKNSGSVVWFRHNRLTSFYKNSIITGEG